MIRVCLRKIVKISTQIAVIGVLLGCVLSFAPQGYTQENLAPTKDSNNNNKDSNNIYIKISEANIKKSLMALPPFDYLGNPNIIEKNSLDIKKILFDTVRNDLDVSGYFSFINPKAYLENPSNTNPRPFPDDSKGFRYENWKKIGTDFLIRGNFEITKTELSLHGYLYHIPKEQLILDATYRTTKDQVRKLAHTFANDVVYKLTDSKGMFLSKLVVAAAKNPKNYSDRVKEIYLMDWDGQNMTAITSHNDICESPAISPDGEVVVYTGYTKLSTDSSQKIVRNKTKNASLWLYELKTKRRFLLSSRPGSNSGAHFSPDGKQIYFTVTVGGGREIIKIDREGRFLGTVVKSQYGAMNVEPAASDNNKYLAFSSDRSGFPMIYVLDFLTQAITRKTFAGRYNASPTWSPDSKKIAFAGHDKDHFDIFLMDADGKNLIRLTDAPKPSGKASSNEDPSFSPDGRHIVFTSDRTGHRQLFIVNLDGSNERAITNDQYDYTRPKWGQGL